MVDMKVFTLVEKLPKGSVLLQPLWIHNEKPDRLKSRMVAFDPKRTKIKTLRSSAKVVFQDSLQMLLALGASQGIKSDFFDINYAFLFADITEGDYYIKTPAVFSNIYTMKYLTVSKAIYGLKSTLFTKKILFTCF